MKRLFLLLIISTSFLASAQVPDYVPTDGLVAWYDCNGDGTDQSGQSPSISTIGDAQWHGSGYLNLVGNGYADIPTIQAMTSPTWTIVMRMKQKLLLWKGNTNYPNNVQFNLDIRGNAIAYVHSPNCSTILDNITRINQGIGSLSEWKILVVSRNSNNLITIATEDNSWTYPYTPSCVQDSPMRIGAWWNGDLGITGYQPSQVDYLGFWNIALDTDQINQVIMEAIPIEGCIQEDACNYDSSANVDDGSCIPSGCMDDGACNYNADAQCDGEACDYSCCPGPGCCGPGTIWDAELQSCIAETPSLETAESCSLFNLQELSLGYLQLAEQNAARDTLIVTQQAAIDSLNALLNNCPGND